MTKTLEQYEIEITRLKAALVTINEQVSELCRMSKEDLNTPDAYDHRAIYKSIKSVSGNALRGK